MPALPKSDQASRASDDTRISAIAATIALGGHAAVLLVALLLVGRAPAVPVMPGVVGVTLVSGQAGAPAAFGSDKPARQPASPSDPLTAPAAPSDTGSAGDRLDQLLAPSHAEARAPANAAAAAGGSPALSGSGASGRSGSSRADRGLGPGEGAEGVDLYAAASLPGVGRRPDAPPSGDLWRRVAPCWRSAAARAVTVLVSISADGGLSGTPQAVRRRDAVVDPQRLLAERAAVRALQACAPYADLGGKQWRVEFP